MRKGREIGKNKIKRKERKMKKFFVFLVMVMFLSSQAFASSNSNAGASAGANATVISNPSAQGGSVRVGVNARQNVSPQSSVSIDSHAVNNSRSRYINRQFLPQGVPGRPGTMQYFGWKSPKWNVFPVIYGEWVLTHQKKVEIKYRKLWKHIYQKFPRSSTVTFVKYRHVQAGATIVASVAVELTSSQGTDDAQAIVAILARRYGGNIIEVLSSSAKSVPTSSGWHIGIGAGAGGMLGGANEKGTITGAGGTGFGESSISIKTLPFIQVRIWHLNKIQKK